MNLGELVNLSGACSTPKSRKGIYLTLCLASKSETNERTRRKAERDE